MCCLLALLLFESGESRVQVTSFIPSQYGFCLPWQNAVCFVNGKMSSSPRNLLTSTVPVLSAKNILININARIFRLCSYEAIFALLIYGASQCANINRVQSVPRQRMRDEWEEITVHTHLEGENSFSYLWVSGFRNIQFFIAWRTMAIGVRENFPNRWREEVARCINFTLFRV